MRQYVIDELRPEEVARIKTYLDEHCEASDLGGLYWLGLPDDLLSPRQYEHVDCKPHCLAVELGDRWVKFEMLVRSRQRIRCSCVALATQQQRTFLLKFADHLLETADIQV